MALEETIQSKEEAQSAIKPLGKLDRILLNVHEQLAGNTPTERYDNTRFLWGMGAALLAYGVSEGDGASIGFLFSNLMSYFTAPTDFFKYQQQYRTETKESDHANLKVPPRVFALHQKYILPIVYAYSSVSALFNLALLTTSTINEDPEMSKVGAKGLAIGIGYLTYCSTGYLSRINERDAQIASLSTEKSEK